MSSVLITGCSSGYGKATAQVFLNERWNVVATMRRPQNDLFEGPGDSSGTAILSIFVPRFLLDNLQAKPEISAR